MLWVNSEIVIDTRLIYSQPPNKTKIESIDSDFCEICIVRVINIDVQSMLECGPAPMTCYAHAIAVYFTGTVRQTG